MYYYFKKFIPLIYYRIEYIITAYISFIILKLKGTNYLKRTRNRKDIKELKKKIEKNHKKRLAIFVAFHNTSKVPKSNLNYIDILNKCSFNIVYIINGKLNNKVLKQLNKIGCYVICRDNIGQDFGAWKDGITLLQKYKITDQLKWLLLCNDSNFCLGGKNSDDFIAKFSEALDAHKATDFISLNCSYEKSFHYQSYFLCLSDLIIQKKSFNNFWKKYLPLNHRFHAIKSGEIKLTSTVLKKFRPNIVLLAVKPNQLVSAAEQIKFLTNENSDLQLTIDEIHYAPDTDYKNELVVIGVPTNNFKQEPKNNADIKKFCESNFGITFPMSEKVDVIGSNAHPFFKWAKKNHGIAAIPKWNFHKIIIGKKGKVVDTFASFTKPSSKKFIEVIEAEIKN